MKKIKITAGSIELFAEVYETETAQAVWDALPISGRANRWGKEIYFNISVTTSQESEAKADVNVGELAFWPPGNAFCIFWGPTPVSVDENPRAASPVNVFGKITGDSNLLDSVPDNAHVTITRVDD